MMRIGLLGGSFNPAHRGHRMMSVHAARLLRLDEVWWLVSPGNPLKDKAGMAPLGSRFASAKAAARGQRIKVTAIEREFASAFTVETLAKLRRRYPKLRFIWLMGADNLAQFHRWRGWRQIAATVPIAVLPRPGYDGDAHAARALGWLRRFVRPAGQARQWTKWRPPALVLLKMPPEPISASALRAADPHWHRSPDLSFNLKGLRDGVTRKPLA